MASKKALTGGTGDVKPQYVSWLLKLSALNATTSIAIPLPVNRQPLAGGKAWVIEVLWLDIQLPTTSIVTGTQEEILRAVFFNTVNHTTSPTDLGDSDCLAAYIDEGMKIIGGTDRVSDSYRPNTARIVLHDGAGHGTLVATSKLFIQCDTANFTGTATFSGKVFYRIKAVGLPEFIGLSQQQAAVL